MALQAGREEKGEAFVQAAEKSFSENTGHDLECLTWTVHAGHFPSIQDSRVDSGFTILILLS